MFLKSNFAFLCNHSTPWSDKIFRASLSTLGPAPFAILKPISSDKISNSSSHAALAMIEADATARSLASAFGACINCI